MYANVEIRIPSVSGAVTVPEEAVLHSGERAVVIIEKAKGLFEPREVELGALGDGYREIRKGVRAGETVVTSSQFLIDSESNLKEAIQKMLAERTAAAAQKPSSARAIRYPPPALNTSSRGTDVRRNHPMVDSTISFWCC